jgi:glycosyltransferase involved in cell wall biosynthesis
MPSVRSHPDTGSGKAVAAEVAPTPVNPLRTRAPGVPRISVIIPTFNRAALLDTAVASLAAQSAPPDQYEVIVVDDGSTDQTAEVCKDYATRLPLQYHRIERSGIATAKNVAIAASRAPILLFLDDDDVADPDLVSEHLRVHEQHPEGMVAVLSYTTWAPWLVMTPVMHFITNVGHYLFHYSALADGQELDFTYFWGGRSSCKKSILDKGGGFRPQFHFGCEDIELGYRLSRFGLKVIFRRGAVQYMNRPITYDDFCRRCERQGTAQWTFSRMYDDPIVQEYCQVTGAERKWTAIKPELLENVSMVHELESRLAILDTAVERDRCLQELHKLYWWTFDAFKIKGMTDAKSSQELMLPDLMS